MANRGAFIPRPADASKTYLANRIMKWWRAVEEDVLGVRCALTHVAARLLYGGPWSRS